LLPNFGNRSLEQKRLVLDLRNLRMKEFEQIYRDEVDAWALYDNAGDEPVLINWGEKA